MTLYELTGAYKALETEIELNPEDAEGLKEILDQIDDDIEIKADNYAKVIANKTADRKAIKDEIDRLTARMKSIDKGIDYMKQNLMESMKKTGKVKFRTSLFSFSVAKNGGKEPLVVDVTVDELPEELVKVTRDVNREALREYIIDTGDYSYGHFADRGESLRIR